MKERKVSRKVISVVVSLLMIIGMIPMGAFVASAATLPVYSSGDWLVPGAAWNSSMNGFSTQGQQPQYSTFGIYSTNYMFMQTEDNQTMEFTVDMYGKRNSGVNQVYIVSIDTNYNHLADDFEAVKTSELWLNPSNDLPNSNFGGSTYYGGNDSSPVEYQSSGTGEVTHVTNTITFTANGSAVYTPQWQMIIKTRASWIMGNYQTFDTSNLTYNDEDPNHNPKFTIQVIDIRELRTLVSMANNMNVDVSDIVNGRDLSGNTLYSQDTVDTMVAALRQRLLCDYSALDAQLARAAQIESTNIEGGLGGKLYDDTLYNEFTSVYAASQAFDRFLMGNAQSENQAAINAQALALQQAIDNLLPSRIALIRYYVDGVLYGQNTVDPADAYNLHDATHERGSVYYVDPPVKNRYEFLGWADANGNLIPENTVITGDLDVYAKFTVQLDGIAPASTSGRWDHLLSSDYSDGRGEHYVTMWVQDTTFNYVQTQDNETFSFYTDFSAFKNSGTNWAAVKGIELISGDADTDAFIDLLPATDYVDSYCVTGNAADYPSDDTTGRLPGENHGFSDDFEYQRSTGLVTWRFIYNFNPNGSGTYNPKWNIYYESGSTHIWTQYQDYALVGGYGNDNEPVIFTINVSDARELINAINKAESVLNNSNNGFDDGTKAALRAVLDDIAANYTLDGSVYYTQLDLDTQVARIKAYIPDSMTIPCDYTELDAAIALAESKMVEYNNNANNHFIDEVWTDFINAYNAATTIDRSLVIIESNANQTLIDNTTAELIRSINALNYQSHVNEPCEYDPIDDLVDDAIATYGDDITDNSNGQYDDDAYQDYLDALEHAQDVIDQEYYVDSDGNNDNQQIIDDALQDLQDAIDALNNPANQNDPCDYTALNAAIAAAESITDSELFTTATYQALQDALDDALAVPTGLYDDDAGNNQQTIDDATDALVAAIDALLSDAIANAGNVSTDGLDSSTVYDLNDAIDGAEAVAADTNATAQDKADAINDIATAFDNLEADKTELEIAIYSANNTDTTGVPQNLVDALDTAVANGELVDVNTDATVQEVAQATQAIVDALADILAQLVSDAQSTDTNGMTSNSAQDLIEAIADAQATLADVDASANDIMDAVNNLQTALNDLEPDKSALEAAIDAGNNVDTTGIDQTLVDALNDAISDGVTVDNNPNATVQEIADAEQAIEDAIAEILAAVIEEAQNTDTTGMTQVSIDALEQAISDGQDAYNDLTLGSTELAQAIEDLQNAIDSLTPDKTALEDAIDAGENVDKDGIPQNLTDALDDAINDGKSVDYDTDATVQEVAQATQEIVDALSDILDYVITQAENTDTNGMTDDSISDLNQAITDAQTVLADPTATADDIADAITEIQNAVDSLTPDKTELQEAVDAAETVDPANLDPTLASDLQDAIDNGNDVLTDPDATVQEIQDAIDQINDVLDQILQDAIDDAEDIINNPDGYDPSTLSDLQDAIDDANTVLTDPDSTAEDKVNALDDLQAALDGVTVDKSALAAAIAQAENTETLGYEVTGVQALLDAVDDGRTVYDDDNATIAEVAAATQAILDAIAGLTVDKSDLEQKISEAQTAANDPTYVQDSFMDDLLNAIADAEVVDNDPNATVQDVWDAIQALEDAMANLTLVPPTNNIIISVFDDEGNSITDISVDVIVGTNLLFSDIESELPTDLSAYIGADEVFLGWTDINGDFYGSGPANVIDTANPEIHLATQLTKLTEGAGADVTVDRYTENATDYTYMVGLNPADTSVDTIVSQLQNRSTEIIVERDGYELTGTDLVGTGCLVKCVNALDHTIVYEVATVILYGDVNGDGLVDDSDTAIIYNDAFFGESVLTSGTFYYIAADLSKDGTLDAFDYFYVNGIYTGGRAFDQTQELYK